MNNNNVRICSIDAKDLYIADHLKHPNPDGYSVLRQDGTVNIKKFINSLDFSLDLIRIRNVYSKIYHNQYFSFWNHGHEFTTRYINVTFKYSNKQYNKFGENVYVKFGYRIQDVILQNHVCIKDGELIAIEVNTEIPQGQEINPQDYGDNFVYKDGKYQIKSNKTLNTVADLRENLYENGFNCDGVHYVRFKRSSGSSRVGKCLFIDERLYPAMHKYELLGLTLRKDQVIDLAAWEAYIALTLSSIIDTIQIDPKSILVVDDYESVFKDKVMATRIVGNALNTTPEEVEISNSIWDGQSLIDKSIMGSYNQYGMILLRNDFFKTCAFNTNIQKFFADKGITDIKQLNGYTLASEVSEIKLITTPSSIKFLKFGKLDEWLTRISSTFGVVKHEKKTHFFEGSMVQTHYQLLNTLQMSKEDVQEFLQPTFNYMSQLKTNPPVLRYHIHYPIEQIKLTRKPLKTKNDIVFTLMGLNEKFCQTQWYADFRKKNIDAYRDNLRYGHVLINGNYSTLLGNPLEMLYQSIGQFSGESFLGVDNIHSTRFQYGKRILGSRSPHVCVGNILLVNNVSMPEIDQYFNLTEEIVCINAINQNIQQRLNGADYDSDTVLLTDNALLVRVAEYNYHKFLVPTNFVESTKKKRYYNSSQKADLDIKTSVNKIGDIINKSQELQSYMWHQLNNGSGYMDIEDLYKDICQLSVMSNIEIDKAKKEFVIDNTYELSKISAKWARQDENGVSIRPYFFAHIAKTKGYYDPEKKAYKHHDTSMDYLEECIDEYRTPVVKTKKVKITDLLENDVYNHDSVNYHQVNAIIDAILDFKNKAATLFLENSEIEGSIAHQQYNQMKEGLIYYINTEIAPNSATLFSLLRKLELKEYQHIRGYMMTVLFNIKNDEAFELVKRSQEPVEIIEPTNGAADLILYEKKFAKNLQKSA